MINLIGWIGSVLLSLCALPLVIEAIVYKKATILWSSTLIWYLGEMCLLIYVLKNPDWILIFNYGFNILCLTLIIGVKWTSTNTYKNWKKKNN